MATGLSSQESPSITPPTTTILFIAAASVHNGPHPCLALPSCIAHGIGDHFAGVNVHGVAACTVSLCTAHSREKILIVPQEGSRCRFFFIVVSKF